MKHSCDTCNHDCGVSFSDRPTNCPDWTEGARLLRRKLANLRAWVRKWMHTYYTTKDASGKVRRFATVYHDEIRDALAGKPAPRKGRKP